MFSSISFTDFKKMMEQKINQMIEVLSPESVSIKESKSEFETEKSKEANLLDSE